MRTARVLIALGLVAAAAAALGDFATSTFAGADTTEYSVNLHGARWVEATDPGPRTWFRLPLNLDTRPDAVSIWIDDSQNHELFINGRMVDSTLKQPVSTLLDVHGVDLTAWVGQGSSVIGVDVVNNDSGPAALRARVTVTSSGHATDLVTGVAAWQATSDVGRVETADSVTAPVPTPSPSASPFARPTSVPTIGLPFVSRGGSAVPKQHAPAGATTATSDGSNSTAANAWGLPLAVAQPGGSLVRPSTVQPAPAPSPTARATPAPPNPENGDVAVAVGKKERALFDATKGLFTLTTFTAVGWHPAITVDAVRGSVPSPFPEWVVDAPLDAQVITAASGDRDLVASVALDLPRTPDDGWIRIGSTGDATVYLDGRPVVSVVGQTLPPLDVATGAGTVAIPTGPSKTPRTSARATHLSVAAVGYLSAYHIGPLLHTGHNVLAVRVSASQEATLYLDGRLGSGGSAAPLVTSTVWGAVGTGPDTVAALSKPPSSPATELGPPASVWGARPPVVPVPSWALARPDSTLWAYRMVVIAPLLTLIGLVVITPRRRPRPPFSSRLAIAGFGLLPGTLLTMAARELGRLPSFRAPGVYTVPVLVVLGVITGAGVVTTLLSPPNPARWRLSSPLRSLGGLRRRARPGRLASLPSMLVRAARARRPVVALHLAPAGAGFDLAVDTDTRARPRFMPDSQTSTLARLISRRRSLAMSLARHWPITAVVAIATTVGGACAYRIAYEPFWQDELFTLAAGQGIRQHHIPIWPSGFYYWKAELYDTLVAVVGGAFGDSTTVLRMMSVVLFVATVIAFGLLLVPAVVGTRRPWLRVGLTALFATMPAELVWAREARMYQLAQLFLVVFLATYLRALREPTRRRLALATAFLLLMYLSHEETFVLLPAVVMVGLLALRSTLLTVNRRWLYAFAVAAVVIGVQYTLAFYTQPTWFGYDHSNRPFLVFDTTDGWYYLTNVYFKAPGGLALLSSFAVVAGLAGLARRDFTRLFLSAFLWSGVFMLSDVFTQRNARYTFITLPVLVLLAALGAQDLLGLLQRVIAGTRAPVRLAAPVRRVAALSLPIALLWMAASMPLSVDAYGLAASRVTNSPYQHKYVDYPYVTNYMLQHQLPGDLFITAAPPNIPATYLGRAPDMIIQTRADDRLLYIFEKNGRAVDTEYGAQIILAPTDLQRVLDSHHRVWLVTDDTRYLRTLPPGFIDIVNFRFHKVAEGASAALYLGTG